MLHILKALVPDAQLKPSACPMWPQLSLPALALLQDDETAAQMFCLLLQSSRLHTLNSCVLCQSDSKPMSGVMAISSRRSSVPMGFVSVLVWVRVIFFHKRVMISAMLGTGRQAVPTLPSPVIVRIFIRGH